MTLPAASGLGAKLGVEDYKSMQEAAKLKEKLKQEALGITETPGLDDKLSQGKPVEPVNGEINIIDQGEFDSSLREKAAFPPDGGVSFPAVGVPSTSGESDARKEAESEVEELLTQAFGPKNLPGEIYNTPNGIGRRFYPNPNWPNNEVINNMVDAQLSGDTSKVKELLNTRHVPNSASPPSYHPQSTQVSPKPSSEPSHEKNTLDSLESKLKALGVK